MNIRSGFQEIIPFRSEYIQQNAFFQADGAVGQSGRNHNGIPGIQDYRLVLHTVAEGAGQDIAQLCMEI